MAVAVAVADTVGSRFGGNWLAMKFGFLERGSVGLVLMLVQSWAEFVFFSNHSVADGIATLFHDPLGVKSVPLPEVDGGTKQRVVSDYH